MTQPDDCPIRWGILATGGIAHAFARDLALQPDGEVVAVGSRSQASADAFGDEFGVPHRHASYQALVNDPDVDVVYVATPHPGHHDAALLAINAGKAVLVEKPFAMDAAQAREMIDAARDRETFLMEAMWTRFLPHIARVREILAAGTLGDVVYLTAEHGQWFAQDRAVPAVRAGTGRRGLAGPWHLPRLVREPGPWRAGADHSGQLSGVYRR